MDGGGGFGALLVAGLRSRFLAVVAAEGGTVRGLRVAWSPMRSIPALLEERGVEQVTPWDLDAAELPEVSDLGEVEIDWSGWSNEEERPDGSDE